jgi:hypothetical protein
MRKLRLSLASLAMVALDGALMLKPSRMTADNEGDNEQSKIQIGFAIAPIKNMNLLRKEPFAGGVG